MPQLWLEPFGAPAGGEELLSQEEQSWGAALPESRRRQYWSSRAALRRRLAALLDCPPADLPLQAPPGRPPQLGDGAGWLGLSHCGTALLARLAQNRLHEAVLRSRVLKERRRSSGVGAAWLRSSPAGAGRRWALGWSSCSWMQSLRYRARAEGLAAGMADQGQPGGWFTSQSAARALQKTHECC